APLGFGQYQVEIRGRVAQASDERRNVERAHIRGGDQVGGGLLRGVIRAERLEVERQRVAHRAVLKVRAQQVEQFVFGFGIQPQVPQFAAAFVTGVVGDG